MGAEFRGHRKKCPVTEDMFQTASGDDVALGDSWTYGGGRPRTISDKPGGCKLTRTEEDLIRKVSSQFSRTAAILNVGNIIDMKWVRI